MSVWVCLRSRGEQKWVGGHRCRGSALSRLSPWSPRRARAVHIVPKQRRAAAHRARRAARCGRRDPGPSRSTGFVPEHAKRAIRVGGHRCRGSALSRLSPRSPRRARAGHIVPKQRRAAAYLHSLRSVEEPLGRLRFLVGSCGIADLWSPNLKDSPPPSPGTFLIVTSYLLF